MLSLAVNIKTNTKICLHEGKKNCKRSQLKPKRIKQFSFRLSSFKTWKRSVKMVFSGCTESHSEWECGRILLQYLDNVVGRIVLRSALQGINIHGGNARWEEKKTPLQVCYSFHIKQKLAVCAHFLLNMYKNFKLLF